MRKKLTCLTFVLALGLVSSASADLVGWWRFNEGSGTTVADLSGNGNDGTLENAGTMEWDDGTEGGALRFQGGGYVSIGPEPWSSIRTQFTIAFWAFGADTLGNNWGFYAGDTAGRLAGCHIAWGDSSVYFDTTSGWERINKAATEDEYKGQWHHWTFAKNAETGDKKIYLDGELWHSGTGFTSAIGGVDRFFIGAGDNGADPYNGLIDDFRLYDTELTPTEVLSAMTGQPYPMSSAADPKDGAMLEDTWVTLTWRPGDFAVSHDVYLGDNFEDVNGGAGDTFRGNQTSTRLITGVVGFPYPDGLVPGTTYYWRVDEVNDADPNSPWKGDVWSFWVPPKTAYNPIPAEGAKFVAADASLSWTPGFGAKLHSVYFGDNADDVANATGGAPVAGASFIPPDPLELEKTYYWRVDQFDGAETHTGDVWSFTTVADIAVTDADMQGWWTLDEGEGTTAVDWSGRGGHGSFVGEPQWVDGYQGSALEFDGGEFVNCGDNAAAGITADFTLAAWVKMNPVNAGQYLGIGGKLSRLGGNADYMGYALVRHSTNVFRLWVGDGDAANIVGQASSNMTYTDADWHHVAGVREGQINALYVDGIRQSATTATSFVPSDLFFQIGRQYSNTNTQRQFVGKIDDVRVYNKALTEAQIAEVMLGNKKLAGSPTPGSDSVVDIRDVSSLSFSAGDGAASHDVYFGQDRGAVAGADNSSPEFQGNQAGTSLSLATLVEFGGGDYYWRIDEVAADGTATAGTIWKFTVPAGLIVDNFESYNNVDPPSDASNRVFDNWIDGFGTTTNGALVGNELPPYGEHGIVQSGNQSMLYAYDNAGKTSEATLTVAKGDWTAEGVTKLVVQMRGASGNAADKVYVALNGTAVVYHDDASATQLSGWNEWVIDLASFGVDLANVSSISIGVGTKNAPAVDGGTGTMYFDEIVLIP